MGWKNGNPGCPDGNFCCALDACQGGFVENEEGASEAEIYVHATDETFILPQVQRPTIAPELVSCQFRWELALTVDDDPFLVCDEFAATLLRLDVFVSPRVGSIGLEIRHFLDADLEGGGAPQIAGWLRSMNSIVEAKDAIAKFCGDGQTLAAARLNLPPIQFRSPCLQGASGTGFATVRLLA